MPHARAGTPAQPADLIDVDAVISAYYDLTPDPTNPSQRVSFGTSGHRGSSLDGAFNELHVAAITQAIADHRREAWVTGPLFLGKDTHALSGPAWRTAVEVLAANQVTILTTPADEFTPTPAISQAILVQRPSGSEAKADGIVISPSHNPPRDGGFKYNPPTGGPADDAITKVIAERANYLLANPAQILRTDFAKAAVQHFDFRQAYVSGLSGVINMDSIRDAEISLGVDPLGGASVAYWQDIADQYGLNLTILNPKVDPTWSFMTLDSDGLIRMDPSSPSVMASVIGQAANFQVTVANDADADRHGIVTPDGGVMNPNHYLAVVVNHLFGSGRPWPKSLAIGKTLVSSSMIDLVAHKHNRDLVEVPVGFKWFVPGLLGGQLGFGGEESAGASLVNFAGDKPWTTDKDGIVLGLLAAEILAATGRNPHQLYQELTEQFGAPAYQRVDAPADRAQKQRLAQLDASAISASELAGDPITAVLTKAPGNGASIGGIKVITDRAWFAARPSGTEDVYKIYAESFAGVDHLAEVQAAAKAVVDAALS